LYAPASGRETRRKLASKTQEGREALADSGKEMRGRILAALPSKSEQQRQTS
jgi:gas vesicle protein